MGKLIDFLASRPVDGIRETVYLTGSEDLRDFPIVIKPVSQEQQSEYVKRCQGKVDKKGNVNFNTDEYQMLLIIHHTVDPDFRSEETLAKLGVNTSEQAVKRFLKAGEATELTSHITRISGFDNDPNDDIEEIKNS